MPTTATAVHHTGRQAPFYRAIGDEADVFRAASRRGLPVLLKGPTGCGKTRFVEAMAHELGRELITVAGHEDLTSADLVGRFRLEGGDTVWARATPAIAPLGLYALGRGYPRCGQDPRT